MQNSYSKNTYEQDYFWVNQMTRVFGWMFLGLLISGVSAMATLSTGVVSVLSSTVLLIIALIEIGLVVYLSKRAMSMEYSTAALWFMIYSALNGVTLSIIFYAYTLGSIAISFFMAAGFFAFMSFYGMVTKSDLTKAGKLAFMGLIGLIIAGVVNLFMQSSMIYWITSFVGVIVFLALTAYDSQRIKDIHNSYVGTQKEQNVAIIGALILYLDFINLFLYILRVLGKRRN